MRTESEVYDDTRDDYLREAIRAAARTLLWQASDASSNSGSGFPMGEADYYMSEVESLISDQVTDFINSNWGRIESNDLAASDVGHDLILTANGHGAGFWDGDYPRDVGLALTRECQPYGFSAEFALWGDNADGSHVCSDDLAWLMVENTVLLDHLNWSA